MEGMLALIIILLFIILASAVSKRISGTVITLPMIYVVLGLLLSDLGFNVIDIPARQEFIQIIAEVTLIMVLASDASRISIPAMIKHHSLPVRLLAIGLPLTMFLGTITAALIFTNLTLAEAAILGILLSPTDASLGQAVISNQLVPQRIRQTLNIESGLNDGIAMPFLLLALAFVTAEGFGGLGGFIRMGLTQILVGTGAGIVAGYLGAKFVAWGRKSEWISSQFQKIAVVALAIMSYALAHYLGGNGFIAAFALGVTFGHFSPKRKNRELAEYVEVEVDLLILLTFMIVFGAVMLPDALRVTDWKILLYAGLSLTVVRMLPVAISLIGAGVRKQTIGFIGWFGPRGAASILYLFTVIEAEHVPNIEIIYSAALITVLISVFAHGFTAAPGAQWYGSVMSSDNVDGDMAEAQTVPHLRERNPESADQLLGDR